MNDTERADISSLILAVVQKEDAGALIDALTSRGLRATRIDTRGGFLKESNVVDMVGTDADGEARVAEAIRQTCTTRTTFTFLGLAGDPGAAMAWPVEIEIGGAVVFVVPVSLHRRLGDEAPAAAGIQRLLGSS